MLPQPSPFERDAAVVRIASVTRCRRRTDRERCRRRTDRKPLKTETMPPSYGSPLIFGDNHDAVHCRKTIPPSSSSRETASIHSNPSETTHTRPVVCTRNRGTKELTHKRGVPEDDAAVVRIVTTPIPYIMAMPPSYGSQERKTVLPPRRSSPPRQGPRITLRYRCVEASPRQRGSLPPVWS